MAYKPAYIWNGTGWDQIGNQAVATLDDYALLNPSASANQTITNTSLTSPNITNATLTNASISGSVDATANVNVTGRLDVAELREEITDLSASSGTVTMNFTQTNIGYVPTAPTTNFTFNVTNVPTDNGKTITVSLFVTQGSTGYIPNVFQVDGSTQTIRWPNGTSPTPTSSAGKVDIFNFTLVRRSNAWTVFGNANSNF